MISAEIKEQIVNLRKDNKGYGEISNTLNISKDYIRWYCKKNKLAGAKGNSNYRGKKANCQCCNNEFIKIGSNKFCSDKCKTEIKSKERIQSICLECGKAFNGNKNKKYCSIECRNIKYNNARKGKSIAIHETRFCKRCGKSFISKNGNQYFCCRQCGKAYRGIGRKYTSSRDERLKEAVEYDKAVNLHTLIKRDNNICQLCKNNCNLYDYEVTASGAMLCGETYPTIDHIYPCSKGGTHTWNNVQLACLKCNREKSDK